LITGLFGRVAASYDQAEFPGQTARRLVAHANLHPGMRVLDAGTGTGTAMLEAARRVGSGGIVLGIDLSERNQWWSRPRAIDPGRDDVRVARRDDAHSLQPVQAGAHRPLRQRRGTRSRAGQTGG
jgi:ubiquinone/menaquinone biosynthesis C-methylase UbiE